MSGKVPALVWKVCNDFESCIRGCFWRRELKKTYKSHHLTQAAECGAMYTEIEVNKKEAEELSVLLMQVSGKLDQSVRFVMDKDAKENFESYRSNAGKVMGEIFLEMLQPLWERYPELRPKEMGGIYEVNPQIYEPHFYKPDENT